MYRSFGSIRMTPFLATRIISYKASMGLGKWWYDSWNGDYDMAWYMVGFVDINNIKVENNENIKIR